MKGQIFIQFVVLDPLIRFAHVMIMLGEELPSLPPLTVRHWFFIIQIFEQLSCSEKQSCHETFYCVEIFFIFQDFWATCGLPWKTVCREFTALNIYIFIHSEFWTTCACTENRFCPEIFHCIEIFFIFQDFWATWACPDNRVCPEFFKPGKWPPPASYATGSVHYRTAFLQRSLAWVLKTHIASDILVLIFILAWSHATENRSIACWRLCLKDACRTKSCTKWKR